MEPTGGVMRSEATKETWKLGRTSGDEETWKLDRTGDDEGDLELG